MEAESVPYSGWQAPYESLNVSGFSEHPQRKRLSQAIAKCSISACFNANLLKIRVKKRIIFSTFLR